MLEERFVRDIESIKARGKPCAMRRFTFNGNREAVPEALVHIWSEFGVASWANGAFQTCDPNLYTSLKDEILLGHSIIEPEKVTLFVLSSFGMMKAWHTTFGVFEIQIPLARIIFPKHPDVLKKRPAGNINLISRFPTTENDFTTIKGFRSALKRLGRLHENEVYGFTPALGLGGSAEPDKANRFPADVHLSLLANITPFRTYFYNESAGYSEI